LGKEIVHSPEQDQESIWIEKARLGNQEAFGKLVKVHMKAAYYSALNLVRNHDDALELSQEAFLRAFKNMSTFRQGSRFYPWLYKILRNLCLTHLRRKVRHPDSISLSDEEGDWDFPADTPDASEQMEQTEMEERIWAALGEMSPAEREILILRDLQETSYAEISDVLGIPMGTVMSRLFNARSRLREIMKPYLQGDE